MKWITRENAKVDRIACPWLIRRFIDPKAEFLFVPAEQVLEQARALGATPFDIPGVRFGHKDGECSFEAIIREHGLTEPALDRLARIVHAADVAADRDLTPEGRGLEAIALGFSILHGRDDHRKIELETPLYDALYAWCESQVDKEKAA